MVRPGNLRRYVDLTLLATPLQVSFNNKTIGSIIQVFLCLRSLFRLLSVENRRGSCYFLTMIKKRLNHFASILLILPLLMVGLSFSPWEEHSFVGTQGPCDRDQCNTSECPVCPSSCSIDPYIKQEPESYHQLVISPFTVIPPNTLSDQGYVKSIFRPPTASL